MSNLRSYENSSFTPPMQQVSRDITSVASRLCKFNLVKDAKEPKTQRIVSHLG